MEEKISQPDYGPNEWDIDFSIDLDLNFSDYLLIGCYLIFVAPVLLLFQVAESIYSWTIRLFSTKRFKLETKQTNYGLVSMISKIF